MRPETMLARTLLLLGVLCSRVGAQGYGYSRSDDPLLKQVKQAIAAARAGDRERLDEAMDALGWQVTEVREKLAVDLEEPLRAARTSGSVEAVGHGLAHLVFQVIRLKFDSNQKDRLDRYGVARARVDAAKFYYQEILSHAVRRADSAEDTSRHASILDDFRALTSALGSPGLFGLGQSDPDLPKFQKAADSIVRRLREVFPGFLLSAPAGARDP